MKVIPNIFTLINAVFGCVALYYIGDSQFVAATFCILFAAFMDLLDGYFARLLGATSELGAQLDSLADVISFGVVPGALAMTLLSTLHLELPWIFFGFVITLGSVCRLAKYNISPENREYFTGLPTPANALFWIGIPHLNPSISIMTLLFIVALSTFLLNSRIKFIKIGIKKSFLSLSFIATLIIASLILGLRMGLGAISGVVVLYVVFSTIQTVIIRFRN